MAHQVRPRCHNSSTHCCRARTRMLQPYVLVIARWVQQGRQQHTGHCAFLRKQGAQHCPRPRNVLRTPAAQTGGAVVFGCCMPSDCPQTLRCCCCSCSGCFDDKLIPPELSRGQLFGWEVVMTFTLISVVYACGVAKPGHGSFTPLAVGLSLVACAGTGRSSSLHMPGTVCITWQRSSAGNETVCLCTRVSWASCDRSCVHLSILPLCNMRLLVLLAPATGGGWTGAALNPARVIGPLAVFRCGRNVAW
jgi:glycerol uptake facilitator-like aquaporin